MGTRRLKGYVFKILRREVRDSKKLNFSALWEMGKGKKFVEILQ